MDHLERNSPSITELRRLPEDRPLLGTPRETTGAFKARDEIRQALDNPSLSSEARSELLAGLAQANQAIADFDKAQKRAASGGFRNRRG